MRCGGAELAIDGTEGIGVGGSEKQFASTSVLQISSNSSRERASVLCAYWQDGE